MEYDYDDYDDFKPVGNHFRIHDCFDGFCGAEDCTRCHPENTDEDDGG